MSMLTRCGIIARCASGCALRSLPPVFPPCFRCRSRPQAPLFWAPRRIAALSLSLSLSSTWAVPTYSRRSLLTIRGSESRRGNLAAPRRKLFFFSLEPWGPDRTSDGLINENKNVLADGVWINHARKDRGDESGTFQGHFGELGEQILDPLRWSPVNNQSTFPSGRETSTSF